MKRYLIVLSCLLVAIGRETVMSVFPGSTAQKLIYFNFDKSKTIASYKNFITEVVVPHIPENGTVIIYGHTDIIGDEKHNLSLSDKRVKDAQEIIEQALSTTGKTGIKFETHASGADADKAPFENGLPEERFYNRTVIINIIPAG